MRKLMLSVLAIAAMFATSCQNDLDFDTTAEKTSTVTFSVGTPTIATRAYSDGATATKLQYAVYDSEGNILGDLTKTDATINGSTTVNLQLTTGNSYSVIFWAAAEGAPYTIDFDNKTMTVDYTAAVSNDEKRDAFYKYHTFTVTGAQTETIELKRPFAQLNIGAGDFDASEIAGYVPTTSSVKVKSIYNTLNLVNGIATGEEEITFANNAIPVGETFPVAGYEYLAMNYLLVNAEKEVVDIEFTYTNGTDAKTRTVGSVPVQRNYRTNIYGQLLTSDVDINININPDYDDDNQYGAINGQVYVKVSNAEEFNAAFTDENVDIIILTNDVVLDAALTRAADPALVISANKALTIDLNGKKLSAKSTATGKNYNMFDVRGTLTVKNGTMEYEHEGENMGWNNFAEIFYVGFNGTLNLDGVIAKNLGGSDMAYVVDMCNATNITVNVNNSTLESPYIPIRVFNNSKTGVNNVNIKNSTLKGKYCFWVQYWLSDGRDAATLEQTLKLDIFNSAEGGNKNTFTFANAKDAPVLYGFNEAVYFDEYGKEILFLTPIEGVEGVALNAEGEYVVTADEGMAAILELVAADEDGFAGKTIVLSDDVDLKNVKTMGESFAPIGSTGERDGRNRLVCNTFKGTFDGNGKTIKGLYQSGWDMGYEWGQYGSLGLFSSLEDATVKNVVIEGLEAVVEGGDISFIAGSATGDCVFENITITNSSIGTYNNGCGGIIGWSGAGTYTFKNITIGEDVVLGGLWGSFDSSIGGIVGQAEPGATYNFENVTINCRIDAYNDCTASYDYYLYRMCGMVIGRCEETTTIDGRNYPDLSKYNMTFNNVTVNYGKWMNYHYCEPTPGHNNGRGMRIEAGYAYDGLPADFDHSQCVDNHYNCIPFDQLIGGAQLGVKGLREVAGITVNYPAEYTCPLCGQQHNSTSNE